MSHVDIQDLKAKADSGAELSRVEQLRLELFERSTRWASAPRAWAA